MFIRRNKTISYNDSGFTKREGNHSRRDFDKRNFFRAKKNVKKKRVFLHSTFDKKIYIRLTSEKSGNRWKQKAA